jgi:hypothetical protein
MQDLFIKLGELAQETQQRAQHRLQLLGALGAAAGLGVGGLVAGHMGGSGGSGELGFPAGSYASDLQKHHEILDALRTFEQDHDPSLLFGHDRSQIFGAMPDLRGNHP